MELPREQVESKSVRKFKTLIVGPPKEGKTQSAFTFFMWMLKTKQPSLDVWDFDFDEGNESLRRKMLESGNIKHLRVFQYKPKQTKLQVGAQPKRYDDLYLELMKDFNPLYDMIDPRTGNWKEPEKAPGLILLDSITTMRRVIEDYVLIMRGKEYGNEKGSGVTFDEQSMFKSKTLAIMDAAFDLPCHVIMMAHTEIRQVMSKSGSINADAQPTGESHLVPMIFGDLRWNLTSLYDAVLYTRPGWKWQTANDSKIKGAGVRTKEKLPMLIEQDFNLILPAMINNPDPNKLQNAPKPEGETRVV